MEGSMKYLAILWHEVYKSLTLDMLEKHFIWNNHSNQKFSNILLVKSPSFKIFTSSHFSLLYNTNCACFDSIFREFFLLLEMCPQIGFVINFRITMIYLSIIIVVTYFFFIVIWVSNKMLSYLQSWL